MALDEGQRRKVAQWIAEGLKLSEIQTRLADELSVRMTYMDVRLLVDDLKLTPKDIERPKTPQTALTGAAASQTAAASSSRAQPQQKPGPQTPAAGKISVSVDQLARPGTAISGKVTFGDGQQADWYFDQAGRLGVAPQQTGYRPSATDLQQFQMVLESELSKLGY